MKVSEIRKAFLDFFEKREHKILPSSSLVPQDDPTLLFTNAGMVQFKKYFLGEIAPDYKNVATVQRCIRAGGKHNDLENVGRTSRHMTFFEMLGNFSFGGYFKEKAIVFAWDFVTNFLKIPKEKIIATVYEEDDEAEKIWFKETDIRKVVRAGKDSNFWTMGEQGPCGPCSELIVVRDDIDSGHKCQEPICDCDKFLEIWNLVFMQYNMRPDGTLEPLKTKNIDTGMGLERISMVVQKVPSVFDTDVFIPIKNAVLNLVPEIDRFALRVVMDAVRCAVFAIADGIMPSNESRGYVIRRIIRRALRYSMNYVDKPFLNEVAREVVNTMSDFWSHLVQHSEIIQKTLQIEEERFFDTISRVLPIFEKEVSDFKKEVGAQEFPADIVFAFWDTHGLPLDVMREILSENSLYLDDAKLENLIESARKKAKKKEEKLQIHISIPISSETSGTEFLGYYNLISDAKILGIYLPDGKPTDIGSGEILVITDKTPFYPEGGGQVGDVGFIRGDGSEGYVFDTKKVGEFIVHKVKVKKGNLRKDMKVILEVNQNHREQSAKHHTTTHLLHSALRKILGTHVRQMGSLVEPKRLRFDFSHPVQLSDSDIEQIENLVNTWIMADYEVSHEYMKIDEAIRMGALAFFGDKYGKIVRVVRIGDVSLELCGGTHLSESGEAGIFKIVRESGVSAGVRRLEAIAGWELLKYVREKEQFISELSKIVKVSPSELMTRLKNIVEENSAIKIELESLKKELIKRSSNPDIFDIKELKVVFDYLHGFSRKELGFLTDRLKEKFSNSVIVLISENSGDIDIVCGTNSTKVDCGELVRKISQFLGGSGGGKQTFAEGKGKTKRERIEIINYIKSIFEGI